MQSNTFLGFIVGEKIITLQRVPSTNEYLKELLSKSEPLSEGTAIMAVDQFSGKGQIGNTWRSTPGKNITASIFLKPSFLSPNDQFHLNIAVSLAIRDFLQKEAPLQVFIKWPNDFIAGNQKVAGLLIENMLRGNRWRASIVGIGVNVNEEEPPAMATSLFLLRKEELDLPRAFSRLSDCLTLRYEQLKRQQFNLLREEYLSHLYRKGIPTCFLINGEQKEGIIQGISDQGHLLINFQGRTAKFGFQEVKMIIATDQ